MKKHKWQQGIFATALGAMVVGPVARAADEPAREETQMLQEVVVTAQKREQRSVDVPASVTSVDAEALARGGNVRLMDYAAQIPGLSVTVLSRGYTSVVLRGISTGISQATPSTAYYVDDAPIGSITAYGVGSTLTPDIDPSELQRIEVLKGPQGTLYGASAVGGLVRYVSNMPDMTAKHVTASVGANTVANGGSGWSARGSFSSPIGDSSAVQLSAFERQEAGFIDNPAKGLKDVNSARTKGARLAFSWQASDNWSLRAWALTQRFKADGLGSEDINMPGFVPVTTELARRVFVPEQQSIKLDVVNVTLKGKIGSGELVSSSTYQTSDASTRVDQTSSIGTLFGLPPPFGLGIPGIGAQTTQTVHTKRLTEELRWLAPALNDRLHYELGLFYTTEDSANRLPPFDLFLAASGAPFPVGLPLANAQILINYDEYSLFTNATYSITDKLEVQGGVRYSHAKQDYDQDYKRSLLTAIPVLISQNVTQNKTTYLASLRYKPRENTAIYARVATGYRSGGPSALPPGIVVGGRQSFDPDSLTSYEIGTKSDFANGHASIEAAVFSTDWKDIQIQTSVQSPAGTFQYFVNGGKAKSDGAEATLLWAPLRDLTFRLTSAYTNSRLTQAAPAVGGLSGDRMPFVPKKTASLGVDYRLNSGSTFEPFVGANFNYIGERRSNFSGKNPFTVPAYRTVNLNVGAESEHWRVAAYVKNLGDSRGINFMNSVGLALPGINPLGNPFTAGVIEPRTLGVEVTARF